MRLRLLSRALATALVLAVSAQVATGLRNPAMALPPVNTVNHFYTVDGWGGVHPVGSSPALSTSAYWYGWDIARGLAMFNDGTGGYTLDGWGGVHAVGSAPPVANSDHAYWQGWDIARAIVMAPWANSSSPAGWTMDGWGGLHPFGNAPNVQVSGYWQGWDIARGLVVFPESTPGGVAGYTLDGWGGLHPFAGGSTPMPATPAPSAYWQGWDIGRSIALVNGSHSGYVLDGWGGLHTFGGAASIGDGSHAYWQGWDIARSVTTWTGGTPGSPGGWTMDGWGGLHPFGSVPDPGSAAYWQGWDIARGSAGPGSGSGSRTPPRPTSRTLNVPYFHQDYELSCEEAALQMALAYEGIGVSQADILNAIGIDWRRPVVSNGQFHWGDPYANFVGDPNGSEVNNTGYGTYLTTIGGAASHFGGHPVAVAEGYQPNDVYNSIIDGHPVIAWVSFDYSPHQVTYYQAFDGRWVQFGSPYEHAVTVVGVNDSSVLVNDPWRGQLWISKGTFESAYAVFNHMAVVMN